MATLEQLETRIRRLEQDNRRLARDLQAARGIGVRVTKMRSKMDLAGFQVEHIAEPTSDHDAATRLSSGRFPTTPDPLSGLEEAFLMGLLV